MVNTQQAQEQLNELKHGIIGIYKDSKCFKNAQQELNILKNDVIGIYKHRTLGVFELVLKINKDAETIETCFISQFGAIQRGYSVPYQQGQLMMFPQGKNMNQMLENPFEFDAFIKSF